jgi:hypothetical protein
MNPLLFADWGRLNRLFSRAMWTVAAVLILVVCVAAAASGPIARAAPDGRSDSGVSASDVSASTTHSSRPGAADPASIFTGKAGG